MSVDTQTDSKTVKHLMIHCSVHTDNPVIVRMPAPYGLPSSEENVPNYAACRTKKFRCNIKSCVVASDLKQRKKSGNQKTSARTEGNYFNDTNDIIYDATYEPVDLKLILGYYSRNFGKICATCGGLVKDSVSEF